MGIQHRKKASEVFRDANFVFSKKVSFDEEFPEIEDVKIVVRQSGRGIRDWNSVSHYGKVGEYIDCANPLCYRGGFSIGDILRSMVRDRQEHYEGSHFCQGYEGSPKGRRKYGPCMNGFHVTVDITYKSREERRRE